MLGFLLFLFPFTQEESGKAGQEESQCYREPSVRYGEVHSVDTIKCKNDVWYLENYGDYSQTPHYKVQIIADYRGKSVHHT